MFKKNKAFSLVELLVVIAILAILATIGILYYSGNKEKAANSKRRADIVNILKAFEAGFDPVTGKYQALRFSDFTLGIPTPPEGGNYNVLANPSMSGIRVCALLDNNDPTQTCSAPADKCICQDSVQGKFIAQGAIALLPPPNGPPPPPPVGIPPPPAPPPPVPPPPPAPARGPIVYLGASLYSDSGIKSLVKSGDQFVASAARQQDDPTTTTVHEQDTPITVTKVNQVIGMLDSIDTSKGMVKVLMLSAVEDLNNLISWVNSGQVDSAKMASIAVLSYNQEGGLSPTYEIGSPADNTKLRDEAIAFADIVHNKWPTKKSNYGPTYGFFDTLQSNGYLATILKHANGAAFQGQNLLPTMTEDAFENLICDKNTYVKNANPNDQLALQLWYSTGTQNPQQTPDQMIRVFNALAARNCIGIAGWGGASTGTYGSLTDVTKQVLCGLNWRGNPVPCP